MKNKLFKLYILGFFLLTNFVMFAQPGDDTIDGNLEGDDPLPTPINGKLIWLAFAGIAFAIYSYKNYKKALKA